MLKDKIDNFPAGEYSRDWTAYMVKAHISEAEGKKHGLNWPDLSPDKIQAYHDNLAKNFESQIFVLPTPILVNTTKVTDVLTFNRDEKVVRVYPPFPVDEEGETAGAIREVFVPEEGKSGIGFTELPSSAVRGVRMTHGTNSSQTWCRAFRLDTQHGADASSILHLLLDHICQYTHQWWIRATHNPMLGQLRMGGTITKDFKIETELRYSGAGEIESTWYGGVECQSNLGFGSPLDKRAWLLASHHTRERRTADQGLLAFYDGMADYMAGRDEKAIISLCIATEIMLSKHSFAILKRAPSKLDKAIRTTTLVEKPVREKLKNLAIDRNQVAHGRQPKKINDGSENCIEHYVQAVRHLVSAYLNAMPIGDWPKVMTLQLDQSKIVQTVS